MREELNSGRYVLTAMDAETFGHHRPGLENMLFEIFEDKDFDLVQISDLVGLFAGGGIRPADKSTKPVASTWASSSLDIKNNQQFLSWDDKDNIIHKYQHEFVDLVLEKARFSARSDLPGGQTSMMDVALASDHFWWASAKP